MFIVHRHGPTRRVRAGAALLATLLPLSIGGLLSLGGRQTVETLVESEPLLIVFEDAPAAAPGPPIARAPGTPKPSLAEQPPPEAPPEPEAEEPQDEVSDAPDPADSGPVLADLGPEGEGGGGGCEGEHCNPEATCTGPDCGPPQGPTGPREVHWSAVKVTRQVQPRMPAAARSMGPQQVSCVVRMTIDTRGRVTRVDPVDCPVLFQTATTEAALKWRFEPMRVDGQALDASFLLTVRYDVK